MVLTSGERFATEMAAPVVVVWLAVGTLLSAPWAFGQLRRFVPLEEK
jgi:hypothetical protein